MRDQITIDWRAVYICNLAWVIAIYACLAIFCCALIVTTFIYGGVVSQAAMLEKEMRAAEMQAKMQAQAQAENPHEEAKHVIKPMGEVPITMPADVPKKEVAVGGTNRDQI